MVIDMRTRLPHGHVANRAADMRFHAERLARCAQELRDALAELQALDVRAMVRHVGGDA